MGNRVEWPAYILGLMSCVSLFSSSLLLLPYIGVTGKAFRGKTGGCGSYSGNITLYLKLSGIREASVGFWHALRGRVLAFWRSKMSR